MAFNKYLNHHGKGVLGYLTDRAVAPLNGREDKLLRQKYAAATTLKWKDLIGHYGCVNAIEFSHGLGTSVASGGDDRRVLLWNVERALSNIGQPAVMKGEHNSNIFCIGFDLNNETIFSGGNDEQVIVHDIRTGETKDVFSHDDAVYGLSPDPTNPSVFASACDDGKVLIFDTRDSCADPFCLANYTSSMHSVMYNPVEPRLLATANAKEGVGLWDVRKPRSCVLRYGGSLVQQSCMNVRFNQRGDQVIALRRRLPPVLYHIHSNEPVCEFDHSGYYNSCTMKSVCFAGDNDQYVLSGSDEFNLYMWAVPEDLSERLYINSAHMVLRGHRSIVNQVRFNPSNHLIISSGVEKIIKVWSAYNLPAHVRRPSGENVSVDRHVYTHEEYINLVLQDGHVMSHDYSQESTEEDPRMMAFFDSLVQRELDGWSSDDSMSSNEEALFSRIVQLSQSDIDSDDSLPEMDGLDTGDTSYSPFTIAFASVMASQAAEGNERFPRLNQALENAERSYANISSDDNNEHDDHSEARPNTERPDRNAENHDVPTTNRDSDCILSHLVKRKKCDMRETLKRRMQDLKNSRDRKAPGDMSNSDVSDSDTSSVSSLNLDVSLEKSGETMTPAKQQASTGCSQESLEQFRNEQQQKLKRLKTLRKRLENSESENSDVDFSEKVCTSLVASESGVEKVQFKKFKSRRADVCPSDNKEKGKSASNSDLGPFIQKTTSGLESRKLASEDTVRGKRNPNDSTLSLSRGKHKMTRHSDKHRSHDSNKDIHSSSKRRHEHERSRDGSNDKHHARGRTLKSDGYHSRKSHCHSEDSICHPSNRDITNTEKITTKKFSELQHRTECDTRSRHCRQSDKDLSRKESKSKKSAEHDCKRRHSENSIDKRHSHRKQSKEKGDGSQSSASRDKSDECLEKVISRKTRDDIEKYGPDWTRSGFRSEGSGKEDERLTKDFTNSETSLCKSEEREKNEDDSEVKYGVESTSFVAFLEQPYKKCSGKDNAGSPNTTTVTEGVTDMYKPSCSYTSTKTDADLYADLCDISVNDRFQDNGQKTSHNESSSLDGELQATHLDCQTSAESENKNVCTSKSKLHSQRKRYYRDRNSSESDHNKKEKCKPRNHSEDSHHHHDDHHHHHGRHHHHHHHHKSDGSKDGANNNSESKADMSSKHERPQSARTNTAHGCVSNHHHHHKDRHHDDHQSRQTNQTNSSSDEDEQPTWMEFKRFKNKLERARKRYKEEKYHRKHKEDKNEPK